MIDCYPEWFANSLIVIFFFFWGVSMVVAIISAYVWLMVKRGIITDEYVNSWNMSDEFANTMRFERTAADIERKSRVTFLVFLGYSAFFTAVFFVAVF